MKHRNNAIIAALLLATAATAANASTFVGSDAFGREATVNFQVDSGVLVITLTNSSTADTLVPIDVLTGVYWSMTDAGALTTDSALLNFGSTVIYDSMPLGGDVGGEFCYKAGISHHGATFGISSAGLGIFGNGDLFGGPNLSGPTGPNGLQYGLVSAGDNVATGNGGITGSEGLIKNSVVFRLGGFGAGFDIDSIANVGFQYGTAVSEPYVPTPGSLAALGLMGAATLRRRR